MPGISKGAALFREERWAESQGAGGWSYSALDLLFDLGLVPSPPQNSVFSSAHEEKVHPGFLVSVSS